MTTRLLSESEYRATFVPPMLEITSREDDVYTEGVIDVEPYVAAIPESDLDGMRLLPDAPPAAVYLSGDGRFNHILYPCNRSNVYLVIIVKIRPDDVVGHYVLALGKECGRG